MQGARVLWLLAMVVTACCQNVGLKELYRWRQVDLEYPSKTLHDSAIASGDFIPQNNLPLGLEVWKNRVFVTLPKWKPGIPVTLTTVPRNSNEESPLLRPYPSWEWHNNTSCDGITSVFRLSVDPCGRLWVLDSGLVNIATGSANQKCPPQILVFDLKTDSLIQKYQLPSNQVETGSLFANIALDIRGGQCNDAYAYFADVARYGLVVYRLRDNRSWRISHHLFYPDPSSCRFEVHGVTFRWTDGIFGLCLSPDVGVNADRTLFFHSMSGNKEYSVPTSILRNETALDEDPDAFMQLGEPRYSTKAQASASAMDRRGVMFYNLVTRDSVGCWNSKQPRGFVADLQGVIANDSIRLQFPNDLKVDQEQRQSVWVLSDRLPAYFYKELDPNDYNFRIMTGYVDEVVKGTVCDPEYVDVPPTELNNRLGCGV